MDGIKSRYEHDESDDTIQEGSGCVWCDLDLEPIKRGGVYVHPTKGDKDFRCELL